MKEGICVINPIGVNSLNKYSGLETKKSDEKSSFTARETELYPLNYKVGRAFAGMSGITFKNLAKPVEVTNLYNNKAEGKDHLDLPNIHVYEFPDTNLNAFIILDNNKKNSKFDNQPQYCLNIQPDKNTKVNPVLQWLISDIIASRFQNENLKGYFDRELMVISGLDNPLNYDDIPRFNELITSNKFSDAEVVSAKENLEKYLSSESGKKDRKYGELLFNDKLKSNADILKELETITNEKLKEYYSQYLNTSEICSYLTIKTDDFSDSIFNKLNKNINAKFLKKGFSEKEKRTDNNAKILHTGKNEDYIQYQYIISEDYGYNAIMSVIISKLLQKYSPEEKDRIEEYIKNKGQGTDNLAVKMYEEDINFWDAYCDKSRVNQNNNLWSKQESYTPVITYTLFVKKSSGMNENTLKDAINRQKSEFKQVIDTDLSVDLADIKQQIKERMKNIFTEETINLSVKNSECIRFGKDIFQFYELVDSISEQDVKDYIKEYFINSEPVIVV